MSTMLQRATTWFPAWTIRDWTQEAALRWNRMWRLVGAELNQTVERARQRQALARLDDRMLHDLGLQRDRVSSELNKWFWQI